MARRHTSALVYGEHDLDRSEFDLERCELDSIPCELDPVRSEFDPGAVGVSISTTRSPSGTKGDVFVATRELIRMNDTVIGQAAVADARSLVRTEVLAVE